MKKLTSTVVLLVLAAAAGATPAHAQDLPRPEFTPFTVAPVLNNGAEVQEAMIREYPAELREQGIGGRVNVWFHVTTEGRAEYLQIDQGSGNADLDAAALRIADVCEFTPAMNRDERVAVWVSLPITFAIPVRQAPPSR